MKDILRLLEESRKEKRGEEKKETECVRLCEQRDGVEEKCDNRSEQKGRVEVEEMLRAVNGGRKATRCGAE